jgi:signal transduction histidine kinase/CheY-like chemotaxis protein/streptogramin lyase
MRPSVISLVAVAGILATSGQLHAQRYNFKFYGEEEGLQNLAVQVVLQDRGGFLWVGTQNGLLRYDGNSFQSFGKNEGLPGSRIESLHESVDGTLWVGTHLGLARRSGDRFEVVRAPIALGVLGRQGIASDRQGRLYVATEQGLVRGTPSGSEMQFAFVPPATPAAAGRVSSVYVDGAGTVWFGCATSLCQLDQDQGREVGAEQGLPPQEHWDAILGDLDGNLWVRSEKSLFLRPSSAPRFQPRNGLANSANTYPTLALDPSGRLLVPTFNGLARQRDQGWEMIGADDGLTTNDISAVVQDREGSIWLGLLGSGLARWLGYNEWQSWNTKDGLSRESVWSIARDRGGRLWVGTQFGLNYAEESNGRLAWRPKQVWGIDMVRTLAPGPDGSVWVGGDPGGLVQLDPPSGLMRKFFPQQGLTNDGIRHVMVDRDGRVWVSTRRGLFRSKTPGTAGLAVEFEQLAPEGTNGDESFLMTLQDHSGRVWVCGDLGLARWSDGQWKRFTHKDGLKADMIAQAAEDSDGSLWIGYRDAFGITHLSFDGDQLKAEHVTVANGLHSDKTLFLGFDPRGWLWAGTDHGVDVFDRVRWRHFGRSDGLIWDDTNSNAFLADANQGVWIGTSKGLSRFAPASVPPPSVPPPVVFTSVKFGDRFQDPGSMLQIPYGQNSMQARFAALTFLQESSVLFRYRLEGVVNGWTETRQRELNYPKLPPGDYTLEVMARNAQGVWSTEPAKLHFQIATPWWLTWWFRVASVVMLLLLGREIWTRRTKRLQVERNRLESAVEERTRELSLEKQRVVEEKARAEQENATVQQQKGEIERLLKETQQASQLKSEFLANMSHEIRTPMNGILGMTDLVLGTELTREQRDYLETARFSAESLLTILNDILDFSKIEAGRLDLHPTDFSLRECLEQTGKVFRVPLADKKLGFHVLVAADAPDYLVGDPDRLRQVLLNLIGNAVKFTEKGEIRVSVQTEPESDGGLKLHFCVRDTGIGIPEDQQKLIFESFRQADGSTTRKYGGTGLGLAICSHLVQLMGGAIWVESAVGQGSRFHFTAHFGVAAGPDPAKDQLSLRNMAAAMPGPAVSLRILLAEDNVINQRLASRMLEKRGHKVTVASTGNDALARLKYESFDIILMDVQMPDVDGLETTAIIRAREKTSGQRTPIVALTAHTMKGDRERCLAAGMDAYITKPVVEAELLHVVETTAGRVQTVQPAPAPEPVPQNS